MTILLAKDFNNRQELEAKVASMFGLTTEGKDAVVKGTALELKKLFLGHGKIFWGIPVEETDLAPSPKIERIDRGKIHKSKLETLDINNSEELGSVERSSKKPRLSRRKRK